MAREVLAVISIRDATRYLLEINACVTPQCTHKTFCPTCQQKMIAMFDWAVEWESEHPRVQHGVA